MEDQQSFPESKFFTRNNDNTFNQTGSDKIGIIIVDVVAGFTTPASLRNTPAYNKFIQRFDVQGQGQGAGYNTFMLAPGDSGKGAARCESMIREIGKLLRHHPSAPVLTFIDAHRPDDTGRFKYDKSRDELDKTQNEYPFPPHCVKGSEESLLDYRLAEVLKGRSNVQQLEKDCFSGFISGFHPSFDQQLYTRECNTCRCAPLNLGTVGGRRGRPRTAKKSGGGTFLNNAVLQWCLDHKITHVVVTGICTDICVMHLVHGLLNVVNHYDNNDLKLKRVYVYEPGTASYDAPGLGHPIEKYHLMALEMMNLVGARIINKPGNI